MRALLLAVVATIVLALVTEPGCRRMRERVLLSLVRESARPIEVVAADPPSFHFPPTAVRVVAFIDYDEARRADGHVSFVPPDGSDRYAWAAAVCDSWSPRCLEGRPAATVDAVTYGTVPSGFYELEPQGGRPAPLQPNHLYGLALLGEKLFALTPFYRDDAGTLHVMDGSRFAEAVVDGRRSEIDAFVVGRRSEIDPFVGSRDAPRPAPAAAP